MSNAIASRVAGNLSDGRSVRVLEKDFTRLQILDLIRTLDPKVEGLLTLRELDDALNKSKILTPSSGFGHSYVSNNFVFYPRQYYLPFHMGGPKDPWKSASTRNELVWIEEQIDHYGLETGKIMIVRFKIPDLKVTDYLGTTKSLLDSHGFGVIPMEKVEWTEMSEDKKTVDCTIECVTGITDADVTLKNVLPNVSSLSIDPDGIPVLTEYGEHARFWPGYTPQTYPRNPKARRMDLVGRDKFMDLTSPELTIEATGYLGGIDCGNHDPYSEVHSRILNATRPWSLPSLVALVCRLPAELQPPSS